MKMMVKELKRKPLKLDISNIFYNFALAKGQKRFNL